MQVVWGDTFRSEMLGDKHIRTLVDYPNAGDCFPGVELRGGVCYFLWDRDNSGHVSTPIFLEKLKIQ